MAVTGFASGISSRDGDYNTGPIGASTSLYRMAIVMRDSSGNLFNGATAAGYFGVGVAMMNDTGGTAAGTDTNVWNNASGSAGDFTAKYKPGIYGPFTNSGTTITAGMEGDVCYIVDNVTVHATSNSGARSPAGLIYRVDSSGVWVEFDEMKVRMALTIGAASGVTFTQTYSTANATVAAPTGVAIGITLTDSTGLSGSHDDTLAATTVPTTLTDSTGLSGTHDDTLAATTVPGSLTVSDGVGTNDGTIGAITDNASTILAVQELAAKINAIITLLGVMVQNDSDIAQKVIEHNALLGVVAQNASDTAQKVIETVTLANALVADDLDNRQSINSLIDVTQAVGMAG